MKTITAHAAKDLRLEDHPEPEPKAGEVLIQMEAGGICGPGTIGFGTSTEGGS